MTEAPVPAAALDPAEVGRLLILLPAVSSLLGHGDLRSTLGYGAIMSREDEFVHDILELPDGLDGLIGKWFGGRFSAARILAELDAATIGAAHC